MILNNREITKGLMIRSPWIEKILEGEKTWEIRGYNTETRGTIALIRSGSGLICGLCDIIHVVGPLTRQELMDNNDRHCIPQDEIDHLVYEVLKYETVYAWVLENAVACNPPLPYNHPVGAVRWVNL